MAFGTKGRYYLRRTDDGINEPLLDAEGNPSSTTYNCHVCHQPYERPDLTACATHDAVVCSPCLSTEKVGDDIPRSERSLLTAYRALSGYGMRASRAMGWLAAAMLVTIVLLMGFGLPPQVLAGLAQHRIATTSQLRRMLRPDGTRQLMSRLLNRLIAELNAAGKLDWSHVVRGRLPRPCKKRGADTGPSPVDRRKTGSTDGGARESTNSPSVRPPTAPAWPPNCSKRSPRTPPKAAPGCSRPSARRAPSPSTVGRAGHRPRTPHPRARASSSSSAPVIPPALWPRSPFERVCAGLHHLR